MEADRSCHFLFIAVYGKARRTFQYDVDFVVCWLLAAQVQRNPVVMTR